MRVVDGVKVAFVESESYFKSFTTPSLHSTAKETGADIVFLLADGKKGGEVSDDEVRELLALVKKETR